jgi:hypothetical protein
VWLIDQDRTLFAQRAGERRDAAAEITIRSLVQSMTAAEGSLVDGPLPDGAVRLRLSPGRVQLEPAGGARWVPVPPRCPKPPPSCSKSGNAKKSKARVIGLGHRGIADRLGTVVGTVGGQQLSNWREILKLLTISMR